MYQVVRSGGEGSSSFPLCLILRILREKLGSLGCQWASLVAQTVKRLPAVRETRVQSLGWEDPLARRAHAGKAKREHLLCQQTHGPH